MKSSPVVEVKAVPDDIFIPFLPVVIVCQLPVVLVCFTLLDEVSVLGILMGPLVCNVVGAARVVWWLS